MSDLAKTALDIARNIQKGVPKGNKPPSEGGPPKSEQVLLHSVVKGTRPYIEKIVYQINGCYENGWYDACAVVTRRLIETLIIETFEQHGIANKIQNPAGDYFYLKDLIARTLNETTWHIGRNAKQALPRLKDIGDRSAHSRRFLAHRGDIDKIIDDLRVITQELVLLANLK
jgi:hypothetical protein